MSNSRSRHTSSAFVLLAALLVTPSSVHARPSQPNREVRPAATTSVGFLGNLGHRLTSRRGASGASIDPWGGQAPTSGGSIDPWGNGTSSLRGDTGVSIDPNG
jgi:hypothetical protein